MIPRFADHPRQVKSIIEAIRRATDPGACVRRCAKGLTDVPRRVSLVSIGKAAASMDAGWREAMDEPARALMVVPADAELPHMLHNVPWIHRAIHPIPDESSVAAGRSLVEFVRTCRAGHDIDGFVVLLSGGASSLVMSPAEGVSLEDVREVSIALMRAGADIRSLNTVRKHLDRLKGGRLAEEMAPKPALVLVLSDVIGDEVSVIGSGPLAPDPSTFADALAVLDRFKMDHPAVRRVLAEGARGERAETPKPSARGRSMVKHVIVGSNLLALNAAQAQIQTLGFERVDVYPEVVGPAHVAGEKLAKLAVKKRAAGAPVAVLLGGECTVDVAGQTGQGGRNQECALAAAIHLDGVEHVVMVSFATDGVDGPPPREGPPAAGAMVTGRTCLRGRSLGLDARASLARHDSHGYFAALDRAGHPHLIVTGPTGTNVNDVAVALVYPKAL
jgi:glycerate 2-kinase